LVFDRLFLSMLLSHVYKDGQEAAIGLLWRSVQKALVEFTPRRPSRPRSALISVAYKSRLIAERFKPFKPQDEDHFLI